MTARGKFTKFYTIQNRPRFDILPGITKNTQRGFLMRYYCTKCGARNIRRKTKSNYGCALALLDLILFIGAFFTFGLTLIGCIIIACCVKKTTICRVCKCENSLIPMNAPNVPAA